MTLPAIRRDFSISEAAQLLHCSDDTVRRRIRSGQLTAYTDERGRWRVELQNHVRDEDAKTTVEVDRLRAEVDRLTIENGRLVAIIDRLTLHITNGSR